MRPRFVAWMVGCFWVMGGVAVGQVVANGPDASQGYRLQTNVRRVAVDVVVTDAKGHPVKGLGRDDFQVFEDGVAQPVRGFDAHVVAAAGVSSAKEDLSLELPKNTFANLVRAPEDRPVTVILYDVLNTPRDAMPYAHEAMVKFIKEQKSGSRIAIFVLGDRLRMLQGFTDDETRLMRALNSKAAGTQQSAALMTDSGETTLQTVIAGDQQIGDATVLLGEMKSLEDSENAMLQQQRLEVTIGAFAQIARFVSALPGRKNLIWMSGSFPSGVMPNTDTAVTATANEFGDVYDYAAKVKEAEDLLNVNHVAVYPVDVRGLMGNPQFSAASNAKGPPSTKVNPLFAQQAAEHGTMDQVAEDTGGRAFYNTNGLEEAMREAVDEGSTYYTLTYAPTNSKVDGGLRKISVKVRKAGYSLAYRRSYFAVDAGRAGVGAAAQKDLILDAGMQHGAPISSELFFEAGVEPVGGVVSATAKEMEALGDFLATKTKSGKVVDPEPVKVQHYEVSYAILGRQLELPVVGEGKYATSMTFALAAYAADSEILNGMEVSVKNTIPAAQYEKIKAEGYKAAMVFVVPVGATALRIAARDAIGGHVGTIEVPLPVVAAR